jgi:ankyrin repeat protein
MSDPDCIKDIKEDNWMFELASGVQQLDYDTETTHALFENALAIHDVSEACRIITHTFTPDDLKHFLYSAIVAVEPDVVCCVLCRLLRLCGAVVDTDSKTSTKLDGDTLVTYAYRSGHAALLQSVKIATNSATDRTLLPKMYMHWYLYQLITHCDPPQASDSDSDSTCTVSSRASETEPDTSDSYLAFSAYAARKLATPTSAAPPPLSPLSSESVRTIAEMLLIAGADPFRDFEVCQADINSAFQTNLPTAMLKHAEPVILPSDTSMCFAIRYDRLDIVRVILGISVGRKQREMMLYNWLCWSMETRKGTSDVFDFFCQRREFKHVISEQINTLHDSDTLLSHACKNPTTGYFTKAILKLGATCPPESDTKTSTAFSIACSANQPESVEALINTDLYSMANIVSSSRNSVESNAVAFAVYNYFHDNSSPDSKENAVRILKMLIRLEANMNVAARIHASDDQKNESVLSYATRHNSEELVRLLLTSATPDYQFQRFSQEDTDLGLAAAIPSPGLVELLLDHRANVNRTNTCGNAPIHCVLKTVLGLDEKTTSKAEIIQLRQDAVKVTQMLAREYANMNAANVQRETPYYLAAKHSDAEFMKLLVRLGAKPNSALAPRSLFKQVEELLNREEPIELDGPDVESDSKLVRFASLDDLLSSGHADVNQYFSFNDKSHNGTVLHYICVMLKTLAIRMDRAGVKELITRLLEHGADVNLVDRKCRTPLHILLGAPAVHENGNAFAHGVHARSFVSVAQVMMVDAGANPNVQDARGRTCVVLALQNGYGNIAMRLLDHNLIDVDVKTSGGNTALGYAVHKNDCKAAELLLALGASPLATHRKGNLLSLAVRKDYTTIAKLLIEAGACLHQTDDSGKTALAQAVYWGRTELVIFMVQRDMSVLDTCDQRGNTPLMIACQNSCLAIVEYLLTVPCVDVNASNANTGTTALMICADNCLAEIASVLLHHGAQVLVRDQDGNTAMMRAVFKSAYRIIPILATAGANVDDIESKTGNSMLTVALRNCRYDVVDALIEAGANLLHVNHNGENVWEETDNFNRLPPKLKAKFHRARVIEKLLVIFPSPTGRYMPPSLRGCHSDSAVVRTLLSGRFDWNIVTQCILPYLL